MAHIPHELQSLRKIIGSECDVSVGTRENVTIPMHSHPTKNYVTVTEGVLYLTLDDVERPVMPGDWCCIPAGAPHAERFVEKTSVVVFWVKVAEH